MYKHIRFNYNQLLRFVVALLLTPAVLTFSDLSDFPGPYCETSPSGCCTGRIDECAVRISTTLCYCDTFCDRSVNGDCCPDYGSFCLGESPPPENLTVKCIVNGITFTKYDAPVADNCNLCKCGPNGDPECETDTCLVDKNLIHNVNLISDQIGWTARNYSEFWGRKYIAGLELRTGTKEPKNRVKAMSKLSVTGERLARHFNAFDQWPGMISDVRDQGWCGSSWAVSTASVASDRFAVQSKGKEIVTLSPQNLLSCVRRQHGCSGGHLDWAWNFFRKIGIVDEGCLPYTSSKSRCKIHNSDNLKSAGCQLPTNVLRHQKYQVGPAYALNTEMDIMHEIQESGPVQATMRVYRDFFAYSDGIYQHTRASRSEPTGFHSVRLLGWGEEHGKKYWLAANSWGTWWGENGLFRIERGTNECEIESYVLATWADVNIKHKQSSWKESRRSHWIAYYQRN